MSSNSAATADSASSSGALDQKKAANSYYYWHGHEKERAKVGDVAPMPSPVLVMREESSANQSSVLTFPITKYTWADGEKAVTVYIDTNVDAKEEFVEDSLNVTFSRRRCQVTFTACVTNGVRRCRELKLLLANGVQSDACSFRVKPTTKQIVLRLVKKNSGTWNDLTTDKVSVTDSDHEKDVNDGSSGIDYNTEE